MARYLLVGAGFSRNWGGWLATEAFEYLLGCPEISGDPELRSLLWRHQDSGGFEEALAAAQAAYLHDRSDAQRAKLDRIQTAVRRMFDDMNRAFLDTSGWEFQSHIDRQLGTFLTRFDGIFTLNQDILLEHFYCSANIGRIGDRRWNGTCLPGMSRARSPDPFFADSWARSTWTPAPDGAYNVDPRAQPLFKLHGSSNWTDPNGERLLIMGGAKAQAIGNTPILQRYAQEFSTRLGEPQTRLMAIGYGFRDPHINQAISDAVARGLELFVIAPEGADLARNLNPTRTRGQIIAPTDLEGLLERSLIGASRRPLRDIFGRDTAEHNKVMRFFN